MRDFFRGKFFITLVFIACFLAGFMLNMLLDGGVTAPRDLIGFIATPFASFGTWVKNGTEDIINTFAEFSELQKENEELKKQVAKLETELADTYTNEVEIERLKKLVNVIETSHDLQYVAADIVSVSADGFGSTFSVNKGTLDGIKLNSVVVSCDGLVGKVTDIGFNWATVTAITDPSMSVGATVKRSEATGVTESDVSLRAKGLLRLSYLTADASVIRGDIVFTSGLGGVFPAGILIGKITEVESEENGLAQNATIEPAASLDGLRRVYITNGAWAGE
ncbi:MAG: rod shape-determining protein MreC [Ruminococcaceae bacterium]|nr:rod shape-determining protein MreC [Oscillospiraceae bacterium]